LEVKIFEDKNTSKPEMGNTEMVKGLSDLGGGPKMPILELPEENSVCVLEEEIHVGKC
jgi:hypothetical protein